MLNIKMTKGLMIGTMAGAAVGGLTALLYAPKNGKELRKDISVKKNELINVAKTKATEVVDDGRNKINYILNETGKLYDTGKEKIINEKSRIAYALKCGIDAYSEKKQKRNSRKQGD